MDMMIAMILITGSAVVLLYEAGSYKMTYNEAAKKLKGKMFTY